MKMAEVIANLEDYSPVFVAKAAFAAIQEDCVIVKKSDLHTIILTTLVDVEGNIDETAKAIEKEIINFSITNDDIKG